MHFGQRNQEARIIHEHTSLSVKCGSVADRIKSSCDLDVPAFWKEKEKKKKRADGWNKVFKQLTLQ